MTRHFAFLRRSQLFGRDRMRETGEGEAGPDVGPMPFLLHNLGCAPREEGFAGRRAGPLDQEANLLEVAVFRAAVLTRFGQPPSGCELLSIRENVAGKRVHALGLKIWDSVRRDMAVACYASRLLGIGLRKWGDAAFEAPVRYGGAFGGHVIGDFDASIVQALGRLRNGDHPDWDELLENLIAAFPFHAAVVGKFRETGD